MIKKNSLAAQFIIFISAIISVAMGFNAYFQYSNEVQLVNSALNDRGVSIVELLASSSIEPLLVFDDVSLNGYAEFTSKQKNIVFAVVVNKQRKSLTHYINKKDFYINQILQSNKHLDINTVINKLKFNPHILFFEKRISFQGKTLAYAIIGLDRYLFDKTLQRKLINIILITLVLSFFVGGAMFYFFKKKIFVPIEILINSTKNIANFKFEEKISLPGSGEMVDLAKAFDSMRIQLNETMSSRDVVMQELSELNDSLEDRVHKRTQELQMLNSKIAHEAMHDPLTGLPNRVLITEQLMQTILNANRHKSSFAVFIMDLDNFKEVNDTLGHPEGDRLLIDVAHRLSAIVRDSDTVGRLGGDEFAMVLPDINEDDAIVVANKIINELLPSFALGNHSIKVGASIGIAMYPQHGTDHTSLIRTADIAMYEAKKEKNNVSMYHPELDKYSAIRLSLMDYLHTAIDSDQLQLYYQPKISLHKNKVISVEALIRWHHPELGLIYPDQFVPIAENSGLIDVLSNWVLERAFIQWRQWQDDGIDLQISVNLSARNLSNPDLPVLINKLCNDYQMTSQGIKVEITESAIMYNPEQVIEIMTYPEMQKLQFSIDDFGTGYSSLNYLKRLPVVEVKIDKSFIFEMIENENDANIVKAVIDLVHNLHYTVVAEGVENIETLEQLRLLGCDEAQGYFFAKPLPAENLLDKIAEVEQKLRNIKN